jgi:hypothetical protein
MSKKYVNTFLKTCNHCSKIVLTLQAQFENILLQNILRYFLI